MVIVTDVLIRNIDDQTLQRLDNQADRLGLSRNEYLRREVGRLAHRGVRSATRADLARSAQALADLADDEMMSQAWS